MVSVISASWEQFSQRLMKVRTAVFVDEQGVSPDLEHDSFDKTSFHILLSKDKLDIATGRLLQDGHIGRVCVLKEFRGLGLGQMLMEALIQEAARRNMEQVVLSSQVHALAFYEKLGFEVVSDEYLEAGIPHKEMKLTLK